ncbi:winged helix-turn-helix domain-containing protein [Actinoplanes sp. NPDC023714]|uniref:ArsR/SmtB family transcription factor n=1 Tax=Actinoplanes sp. NPDC023714 TaxID=3154322 RepID=UPI0033F1E4F2
MAEREQERVRISDARTLRALAHPARIEIVDHLTATGAAMTATECARLVGLSPSATSYHLRELAKYGLVEQAPSQGDGRERRWRSTGSSLWIDSDAGKPDSVAAEKALIDIYLTRDKQRLREWVERQAGDPQEWRDASSLMGQQLMVTAGELTELNAKIRALLEPYRVRDRQEGAPEGARHVVVQYAAFPMA